MSEKKIDLSNVKVGNPLWTINSGDTVCEESYQEEGDYKIYAGKISYTIDGKLHVTDDYPSCFHSYQEFLDFHAIAPVKMTEKELFEKVYGQTDIKKMIVESFKLAGGQIIEEPKNLPCFHYGEDVMISDDDSPEFLVHKENGCILSCHMFLDKGWNDPSKWSKV